MGSSRILCNCKQISGTISAFDFMDICLILAGECLIHAVFHQIGKSANLKGIICYGIYGIVIIQSMDFRIVPWQNLYVALIDHFPLCRATNLSFPFSFILTFDCMILQQLSNPFFLGNKQFHHTCVASDFVSAYGFL